MSFKLIDNVRGYNSSGDKTKISPDLLIRGSKNVYKTIRGTVAVRPGILRRGSVDSTEAPVKSSYEWQTNVGTTRVLRVCNNKLQVESDIVTSGTYVWYDLLETSSLDSPAETYTRFVFDTWWDNDEKTDRLLMVRGDDKILHWSGGMAKVASSTANTITISGDYNISELGFASQISGEKKLIISGVEYTYTAISGKTFTGVSGDASGLAVDSVIIQSVMVGDNAPIDTYKADFIKVIGNQAWVGSYSSRVVYISADVTTGGTLGFLNFTNSSALVVGDPDAVIMDSPCRGIGVKDGYVILFSGNSDAYVITPNFNLPVSQSAIPLTGGTSRNVLQKIEKKKLPALGSALGHEFIDNLGEYLIWLDQKNRLRAIGFFANIDSLKPINLSISVQNELSEDDFTGGHLRVIADNDGDTVYITAPNNARDWMYQIRESIDESGQVITERLWQPPQVRGIARFAVIGGVVYGHSNANPQLYQIWETGQYSDDHPSEQQVPYSARAFFAYNNHGERTKMKVFEQIYVEGYMNEGNELNCKAYYDYQGGEDTRDLVVSSNDDPASSWLGIYPPSLGDSSLGDNPLGNGILPEGGSQELLAKFRAILDVDQINCFEYALEFYSSEVDSRWEILSFGTDAKLASQKPTHIKK